VFAKAALALNTGYRSPATGQRLPITAFKGGIMALMDDLMKKTEEGLKTLKETAGEIAFKVEKQARIAKRKMDIIKIQRKIQKLYAEIGEYVYGEFTMERPLTMEAPFLAERMASVADMKSEIREIEAEIEETRKVEPPLKSGDQ
jgi:hypothetical protein